MSHSCTSCTMKRMDAQLELFAFLRSFNLVRRRLCFHFLLLFVQSSFVPFYKSLTSIVRARTATNKKVKLTITDPYLHVLHVPGLPDGLPHAAVSVRFLSSRSRAATSSSSTPCGQTLSSSSLTRDPHDLLPLFHGVLDLFGPSEAA